MFLQGRRGGSGDARAAAASSPQPASAPLQRGMHTARALPPRPASRQLPLALAGRRTRLEHREVDLLKAKQAGHRRELVKQPVLLRCGWKELQEWREVERWGVRGHPAGRERQRVGR